jgi:hypothetical protein
MLFKTDDTGEKTGFSVDKLPHFYLNFQSKLILQAIEI